MTLINLLLNIWPVLAALIGFVVWLVRLEGKTKENETANMRTQKDIDELRIRHESLDSKVVEQLSSVRESLARIEGALGVKKGDQ